MDHKKIAIQEISKLGYLVKRTKDKSKGYDHKIILIYTNKGNFVYRYCKNHLAIMSQAYACEKWKGLKLPKTILLKKSYLIETMIEGKDMDESKLSKTQKIAIMTEIGKLMKKMHTIKTKRYGYLISPGVGQVNSWKKYISRLTKRRLKKINLNKKLLKKVEKYLLDNAVECKTPVLLHKDINPENIMIKNGKLSGIIDAADAVSGDPMYDVAIVYDRFRNHIELADAASKAYGKIDEKKLQYYKVINIIRRIYMNITKNKNSQKDITYLEKLLE